MSADVNSAAADVKTKSRWIWVLASVAGIVLVFNALINLFGQAAIMRAGLAVQQDATWIVGMLMLRIVLYSVSILVLRKYLVNLKFTPPEIKAGTWMMVRVCLLYELLFGLKIFGVLSQLITSI